ncbi:MAG: hypothetical protein HY722_02310 [Planctomycetes bacterium]|nr:hypothetical protein [Planctomycetota bacterium]
MAESRFLVVCEGDVDYAFLAALQKAGLVSPRLAIPEKTQERAQTGWEALPGMALNGAQPGIGVVAVGDLDDVPPEERRADFARRLAGGQAGLVARPAGWCLGKGAASGRIGLVLAGVGREHPLTTSYGLRTFSMEDYLLALLDGEPGAYPSTHGDAGVPRDPAFRKLEELRSLMVGQAIPIPPDSSKRCLDLLCGITGWQVSRARLAQLVVEHLAREGSAGLRSHLEGLLADIASALDYVAS